MADHPYGLLSLLPPIVAIVLAILTRRVIVSLLAGVFAGVLITTGGDPVSGVAQMLEWHLWKTLVDEDRLRVFAFTLAMGAMVGILNRSAGMKGLVDAVTPLANTRRRGQLVTWFLGLLVFFDDYANTVLLGNTLRPLTDRLRISREKLAYLVDSTAAPVAGLALVSTWVAGEIGYVRLGLEGLGSGLDEFELFVASIPYRFYVLWALVLVPLIALLGRDFGPMWRAEQRRLRGDQNALDEELAVAQDPTGPQPNTPARWYNAVLPVAVTVVSIVGLLMWTGTQELANQRQELDELTQELVLGTPAYDEADQQLAALADPSLMQIFGNADSYLALLWGSVIGLVFAIVLIWGQSILTSAQIGEAASKGARMMLPALAILWLAASLSGLTGSPQPSKPEKVEAAVDVGDEPIFEEALPVAKPEIDQYPELDRRLYTGAYLNLVVKEKLPLPSWSLPTIVFVLAGAIAFATGTSWGTMGIVMPLVIPLCYGILTDQGIAVTANNHIFLGTIGSVLAGAIFGDHCSPISDTTVLSSQASGCDHVAHVHTQMPYAVLVGVVSIVCGTLPIGFGMPPWALMPLGVAVLFAFVLVVGRPVGEEPGIGE